VLTNVRWVHTIAEEGDPVGPFLAQARAAGATTSLDIEYPFVTDDAFPDLLGDLDVAFLNAAAAESLGGSTTAAAFLHAHGVPTVLVTLGSQGAMLSLSDGQPAVIPIWPVDAIDTNGAGDAFAGAFAAGILKGLSAHEAAELAVFYAGISTTALGGHGPDRSLEELRSIAKARGADWWDRL